MAEHIELRREIEALATKIIVEDWSSETGFGKSVQALATAVSGVGESAEAFGYPDVARIAAELSTALNTLGPHDELAQALEHGVAEMQRAFENSSVTASPPEQYSLAQDPELLSDFVLESREHLAAVESLSLALEQDPGNSEALHSIFRAFHTIKGLAGFLELDDIREVSHHVETVLDLARNGNLAMSSHVIDVILESADFLKVCARQ